MTGLERAFRRNARPKLSFLRAVIEAVRNRPVCTGRGIKVNAHDMRWPSSRRAACHNWLTRIEAARAREPLRLVAGP